MGYEHEWKDPNPRTKRTLVTWALTLAWLLYLLAAAGILAGTIWYTQASELKYQPGLSEFLDRNNEQVWAPWTHWALAGFIGAGIQVIALGTVVHLLARIYGDSTVHPETPSAPEPDRRPATDGAPVAPLGLGSLIAPPHKVESFGALGPVQGPERGREPAGQ